MQNTYTPQPINETRQPEKAISAAIHKLREEGLLQIVLPGNSLDFTKSNTASLLRLLKDVGRTDLSLGRIYEGHINALLLIHLYGTDEQKKQWQADVRDGHLFGVWNTQSADGVELHVQSNDSFCTTGKKTFASGAGLVSRALVTGHLSDVDNSGWQMCIVNADALPQHNIDRDSWHPMGMQSSLSYTVDFTGYCGSRTDLLAPANVYYNQPYFGGGAIRFCAVQLGGAEALFNETIHYLKSLNRTDDLYQNTRIGEMATEITSGNNWLAQAAQHWDAWIGNRQKNEQLVAFVNFARTAIERICLRVTELSAKCLGARGLMQPYRAESILRDLQFYLRQPAPDAVLSGAAGYVIQSGRNIENVWNDNETTD